MAGKRRLNRCPAGCSNGQIPRKVKAVRTVTDKDGRSRQESYTETVMSDCPTCDGSGQVVDFDG